MPKAKQPVGVAGIEFDALIDISEDYSADIPDYPVEDGYEVQETVTIHPMMLNMTLFLTNTPVTWASRHMGLGRAETVLSRLKEIYERRQPITVVTSSTTYKNMCIESWTSSRSADVGYAYEIPITLKEIKKTSTAMIDIPVSYGKSGSTGTNAGTASVKSVSGSVSGSAGSSMGGSVLYNMFG